MADSTRRTTFLALMNLTQARLQDNLGLPSERIFKSLHPVGSEVGFKADQYVILRPGGFTVDGVWTDSEGRLATTIQRDLIVEAWYRNDDNDITRNDKLVSLMLDREDNIIDWLQIWEPDDALEPFHFRGGDPESARPAVPKWATSVLHFNVKFNQAVNQARQ